MMTDVSEEEHIQTVKVASNGKAKSEVTRTEVSTYDLSHLRIFDSSL